MGRADRRHHSPCGQVLDALIIALAVVLGLLGLIGCADLEVDDPVTTESPAAARNEGRPTQEESRPGEKRSGKRNEPAGREGRDGRDPKTARPTAVVTRVVDGDTVELDNGETVRLIGIDTPEVYGGTECGGAQASVYMESIAAGRRVSVRTDPTQDRYDRYGRLLGYVDAGGKDLGEAIVRVGWAQVYVYDEPFERLAAYRQAARSARRGDRGIWRSCSGS